MDVQLTDGTLQTLVDEAIQHGTAVVAEGRTFVGVDGEAMWHVDVESSHTGLKENEW